MTDRQAVGVGRKVNPDDLGLVVHDVIDGTGVLVREAVQRLQHTGISPIFAQMRVFAN